MPIFSRKCNKCGKIRPIKDFQLFNVKGCKYYTNCRYCFRKEARIKYKENIDKMRAKNRAKERRRRERRPIHVWFLSIKNRARTKGLEFNLTEEEDFKVPNYCPVLKVPLFFSPRHHGRNMFPHPNTPSMDRIDNTKGYIKGNVVITCFRANQVKGDATLAELEALAAFYRGISNGD